ncbi:cephalosporin hydroxylase family protein [Cyanobium gracile]|nr:cephalosporin hydroxylase family protein [Cyanobium gracile]
MEITSQGADVELLKSTREWFGKANKYNYSYHFEFLGRPLIQYPQDIVQVQELISLTKPDLIIETGIAHGGSLVLTASMLCLLDVMEGKDPRQSSRKVVGVDIDIRPHNRIALDEHPLRFKMELIQGSSIDRQVIDTVRSYAVDKECVLVSLDSNHTHQHVLAELNAYAGLVSLGSYCIVFDTVIEDLPAGSFSNRPWDIGNNPMTAVDEWLTTHPEFEADKAIDDKLLITVARKGYLKRIR